MVAASLVLAVGCEPAALRPSSQVKFRLVKTISHTLRGNYHGDGPDYEHFSTPAVADITGDGQPEIVFTSVDGYVFAVRASDGHKLWTRDLGRTSIQAAPAIGQLTGSSAADVVVATMDNRIFVLDGPTGKTASTIAGDRTQFCPGGSACRPAGFFGAPAIADVNGDFKNDIVASSYDHNVYAWKADGSVIFRQFVEDTVWSSPVVRDIDGDHKPEVIVGGDIYAGNNLHVPAGGLVWIFTRGGGSWKTYPRYPKSIPDQTVWSTPAIGDLNGDGNLDVVVGTGNYYPRTAATQKVYAFTARTGENLPGWPVASSGQVSNGPVVADVDRDGKQEVAFTSEGNRVYVRNRNGGAKWTKCALPGAKCDGFGGTHGSVSMADLDGDGVQEVLATTNDELVAFDGRTGAVKGRTLFGPGFAGPSGAPTVAVIDKKSYVIIQATAGKSPVVAGNSTKVFIFTTDQAPGLMAWPTFKRVPSRSG